MWYVMCWVLLFTGTHKPKWTDSQPAVHIIAATKKLVETGDGGRCNAWVGPEMRGQVAGLRKSSYLPRDLRYLGVVRGYWGLAGQGLWMGRVTAGTHSGASNLGGVPQSDGRKCTNCDGVIVVCSARTKAREKVSSWEFEFATPQFVAERTCQSGAPDLYLYFFVDRTNRCYWNTIYSNPLARAS